jgi:hypothetical protein
VSQPKIVVEQGDGCGWFLFCAILATFLFLGEPDIQDLAIQALSKYVETKP